MSNYPLHRTEKGSNRLMAQPSFYSDECAERKCDLHLRSELYKAENGKNHTAYRLHAYHPHTIEDALKYEIYCPECKTNLMKQIGRCRNSHVLGLYICPRCEKK